MPGFFAEDTHILHHKCLVRRVGSRPETEERRRPQGSVRQHAWPALNLDADSVPTAPPPAAVPPQQGEEGAAQETAKWTSLTLT